jgi:hypothetical protein
MAFFYRAPDLIFGRIKYYPVSLGMERIDLSWSGEIKYSEGNGKFFGGSVTKDL